MAQTDDMDLKDIGPIQLLAVAFDEPKFTGEIADELKKLRDNKFIRIVDGLVVQKDAKGKITVLEESDLTKEQNKLYGQVIGSLIGIGSGDADVAMQLGDHMGEQFNKRYEYGLDKEDIEDMAEHIPKGDAVMILLVEHTWAIQVRNAMRDAGGILLAQDFLSPELLISLGKEAFAGHGIAA